MHRCLEIAEGVGALGDALRLHVSEDGADAERLDALTGHLRRELLQLDVEDVSAPASGQAPPGTRAVDPVAVAELLVTLGRSAEGLRAVVLAVRQWLRRGDGVRRTVRLEIGGDVLELSEATVADQQRLVDVFVERHAVGAGG